MILEKGGDGNRRIFIRDNLWFSLCGLNCGLCPMKLEILKLLSECYNDGSRKSFFCLAVNLQDLEDLKTVMEHLAEKRRPLVSCRCRSLYYISYIEEKQTEIIWEVFLWHLIQD